VRVLNKALRAAFPDFRPETHWPVAAGALVTTSKTYHGTHQGEFIGIPARGKRVSCYSVDAIRAFDGKITEHRRGATVIDPSKRGRGEDACLVCGAGWKALHLYGGGVGQDQAIAPFAASARCPLRCARAHSWCVAGRYRPHRDRAAIDRAGARGVASEVRLAD